MINSPAMNNKAFGKLVKWAKNPIKPGPSKRPAVPNVATKEMFKAGDFEDALPAILNIKGMTLLIPRPTQANPTQAVQAQGHKIAIKNPKLARSAPRRIMVTSPKRLINGVPKNLPIAMDIEKIAYPKPAAEDGICLKSRRNKALQSKIEPSARKPIKQSAPRPHKKEGMARAFLNKLSSDSSVKLG